MQITTGCIKTSTPGDPTTRTPAWCRLLPTTTSPRAGIILKPTADVSLYASYSTTYLPASGDQFGSVTTATQKLEPEKYENYEVDLKWDVTESLAFTAAAYEVDRTNVRFAQPNGTFLQTGKSEVQGIEVTLTGYVTDRWQVAAGYGHQTGELTSATSAVLVAGTPLPLLPSDTFSLWNSLPAYARRNNSEYGLCPTLLHFHQRAPAIKDVMRR